MTKYLILFTVLFIGSLALLPAVSMLDLPHLPGDITLMSENVHIYLPFTSSFIAAVSLSLLYFFIKR